MNPNKGITKKELIAVIVILLLLFMINNSQSATQNYPLLMPITIDSTVNYTDTFLRDSMYAEYLHDKAVADSIK